MEILAIILFSLAVSADGFGVGLAYGMRKIHISLVPLLVICMASVVAISISMYFGSLVASLFTPDIASMLGGFILIAVGAWIFFGAWSRWRKFKKVDIKEKKDPYLMRLRVPGFGIVIQILKEPEEADFDRSGNINYKEAMFLGFALAMDAFGAGFGAAVAGYHIFLVPIFVGVSKFVLTSAGLWLGQRSFMSSLGVAGSLLPGIILIVLGISQM